MMQINCNMIYGSLHVWFRDYDESITAAEDTKQTDKDVPEVKNKLN